MAECLREWQAGAQQVSGKWWSWWSHLYDVRANILQLDRHTLQQLIKFHPISVILCWFPNSIWWCFGDFVGWIWMTWCICVCETETETERLPRPCPHLPTYQWFNPKILTKNEAVHPNLTSYSVKKAVDVFRSFFLAKISIVEKNNPFTTQISTFLSFFFSFFALALWKAGVGSERGLLFLKMYWSMVDIQC